MNQNMACKVSILLLVSPTEKNSQNIPRPAFREMMIRPFLKGQRPKEYKHELKPSFLTPSCDTQGKRLTRAQTPNGLWSMP